MTDQMDVDPDAMSGKTCLPTDGKRMLRSGKAITTAQEEDLIEMPDPEKGNLSAIPHMDQSSGPSAGPPVKKQRTIFQIPPFIGLASSRRNTQRRPEELDAERLRVRIQASQAETAALQKKNDDLKVENGSVRKANEEITQWNSRIQHEYGNLVDKYNDLKKSLEREQEDHRKENTQLKARVNDLSKTNDRLRQMIVPVSEKQVLDSDVVSRFTSLRQSILALVRQTWIPTLKSDFDIRQLSKHQQEYFASSIAISYERLRHLVFQGIYVFILGPRGYFLRYSSFQLEQRLQKVERELDKNSSGEDLRQVMEWRVATFKATERFRDDDYRLSRSTRNRIWCFFNCVQLKDEAAEKKGKKKLKAICDSAVELGIMIRQLKDKFKVDILEDAVDQHISHCDEWAEEVASIPAPPGVEPGTIAYVIAGALFKSPKEDLEKILTLEKAEVAVYE